jgi:hypothetical protein
MSRTEVSRRLLIRNMFLRLSIINTPFRLSPDHFAACQAVVFEPEQSFYACLFYSHVRLSFHYIGM